jgi:hypothetical protein
MAALRRNRRILVIGNSIILDFTGLGGGASSSTNPFACDQSPFV